MSTNAAPVTRPAKGQRVRLRQDSTRPLDVGSVPADCRRSRRHKNRPTFSVGGCLQLSHAAPQRPPGRAPCSPKCTSNVVWRQRRLGSRAAV